MWFNMALTVHCMVKNEERFVGYALRSVISHADSVLVYDTGFTDKTSDVIARVASAYPGKIVLEHKGAADPARHTALRQEMIERTTTDWFMILDGDEIWTERGIEEAVARVQRPEFDCLIAPFYLCVGDIYHASRRGAYTIRGKKIHATPRFFRRQSGMRWSGEYNHDAVVDHNGKRIFEGERVAFLQHCFWHASHLIRSENDESVYSSGGTRREKRRLTYTLIGKKIHEPVPEVFMASPGVSTGHLQPLHSFKNFFSYL